MDLRISDLPTANEIANDDLIMITNSDKHSSNKITLGSMAGELWKLMYEMPVIVVCGYCGSHNIITNSNCVQCGAPGKYFIKIEKDKYND